MREGRCCSAETTGKILVLIGQTGLVNLQVSWQGRRASPPLLPLICFDGRPRSPVSCHSYPIEGDFVEG